jgi:2-haloacid dehalogenase
MTSKRFDAVVFDAYGTLFDVHGAMARYAAQLGRHWTSLATEWRSKQLEYSWIGSLTGHGTRRDFASSTADALDYVMARHGIANRGLRDELLRAYERLDAYPEVPAMLKALRERDLRLAILSNGTPAMLAAACAAAGIASLIDAVISVEQAAVFKPAPAVYALVQAELGIPPIRCLFVSGNPWDSQAAEANGFPVLRVNRQGDPDEYGLRQRLLNVSTGHMRERVDSMRPNRRTAHKSPPVRLAGL